MRTMRQPRGATALPVQASSQSSNVLMATLGAPVVGGAMILAFLLSLAGCSDSGDPTGAPPLDSPLTVSYAADVQPIWSAHCTSCHGAVANAGMDLRASAGTAMLVNVASVTYGGSRVVPGSPETSVLYLKLQGDVSTGDRMPLGGAALSAGELEKVRLWIAGGALND
jgi:hypothetical protein